MSETFTILIVDDNPDDVELMRHTLKSDELQFTDYSVDNLDSLEEQLSEKKFDLYLVDYNVPGFSIDQFLACINRFDPLGSIIIVTGTMTEDQVVGALQYGARDYVMKDNMKRLPVAIRNELKNAKQRKELLKVRKKADEFDELLKMYVDNIDDIISIHDLNGKYIYVSPSAERIYGYTTKELMSQDGYEYVHPDDRQKMKSAIDRHYNEKLQSQTIDWRRRTKDGSYVWLETKSRLATDADGNPKELVFATRNVSGIRQAELALDASEKRFRSLVQNSSDYFTLVDKDGVYIYNSPSFYEDTGYKEEDVIGQSVFAFIHEEDLAYVAENFQREIQREQTTNQLYTYRYRIANGTFRHFESKGTNQVNDPSVNAFVVSTRDISDRIEYRQEIEFQSRNIQRLSDSTIGYLNLPVDADLWVYIGDQLREFVPNAVIALNEYNSDNNLLVNRNIKGFGTINKILAKFANQISEGSVFTPTDEALEGLKKAELIKVEGGIYELMFKSYPRRVCEYVEQGAGIKAVYTMGLVWNQTLYGNVVFITFENTPPINKRIIETFMRVASVALQRKNAEDIIVRSLREKEVMLKEIHHRVKNNLQIVSSLLELQAYQIKDPATRLLFSDSQTRVRSMALVHERIYQSDDLANINYSEYLEQLISYLFESYMPRNITPKIDADNVMLSIDSAVPLGIIINELVTNSIKYAFPNGQSGHIFVSLKQDGNKVVVHIGDDGIGLPDEVKIGDHPTLGLELVNALIQQLNANIETKTGKPGTHFEITLDA